MRQTLPHLKGHSESKEVWALGYLVVSFTNSDPERKGKEEEERNGSSDNPDTRGSLRDTLHHNPPETPL